MNSKALLFHLLLCFVLLLPIAVEAKKKKDYQEFKYLDINIKKLLHMPPPSNSSDQTMAELVEVIKITELEHPEPFTSKLKEMDEDPSGFIYNHYKKLTGENLPKNLTKIIESGDVETLAIKLKLHYNRPRPYELALRNKIYLRYNKKIQKQGTAGSPSYPSGHTMIAYFAAHVAAFVKPELKDELLKRAEWVAYSRMYEGVHFRSDNDFSIYLVENVLMPAFLKAI